MLTVTFFAGVWQEFISAQEAKQESRKPNTTNCSPRIYSSYNDNTDKGKSYVIWRQPKAKMNHNKTINLSTKMASILLVFITKNCISPLA